MKDMTYSEILGIVVSACNKAFYSGYKESKDACIESGRADFIPQDLIVMPVTVEAHIL